MRLFSAAFLCIAAGPRVSSASTIDVSSLALVQQRATLLKTVQDVVGDSAPLTESGYQLVVSLKSDSEMKNFIHRLLEAEARYVLDTSELNGMVPYYSGNPGVQSLEILKQELRAAPWVGKGEGRTVALSEVGYQQIVQRKSRPHMAAFARRILDREHKNVTDEGAFSAIIPYYSGEISAQGFDRLKEELTSASWTTDATVEVARPIVEFRQVSKALSAGHPDKELMAVEDRLSSEVEWSRYSKDCYPEGGADDAWLKEGEQPVRGVSLDECRELCLKNMKCEAITYSVNDDPPGCWGRQKLKIDKCHDTERYFTEVLDIEEPTTVATTTLATTLATTTLATTVATTTLATTTLATTVATTTLATTTLATTMATTTLATTTVETTVMTLEELYGEDPDTTLATTTLATTLATTTLATTLATTTLATTTLATTLATTTLATTTLATTLATTTLATTTLATTLATTTLPPLEEDDDEEEFFGSHEKDGSAHKDEGKGSKKGGKKDDESHKKTSGTDDKKESKGDKKGDSKKSEGRGTGLL